LKLHLVPTPIGNLQDMTFRAVDVLNKVSVVLAEDTRTSGKLLSHYAIETPMQSYHAFNEHRNINQLVQRLQSGEEMALITDAGTPGISDPGFLLVRACVEAGVKVESLPGATAFVPALVNSGLPCDRFIFEGFLPTKKGRNKRLQQLVGEKRTIVFYESPFRLVKLLEQLAEILGPDRIASVSRELTKIYEETQRGTLTELATYFKKGKVKGEIVVVVRGE